MIAERRKPVAVVDGRDVYSLTSPEWADLKITMKRYYSWLDSGRTIDPWASGVASASRYDKIQIKHHKAHSGYDAGRCAEPEPIDPALLELDSRIQQLPAHDRALLYWRFVEEMPVDVCMQRLGLTLGTYRERIRRLAVKLHYRLV